MTYLFERHDQGGEAQGDVLLTLVPELVHMTVRSILDGHERIQEVESRAVLVTN